MIAAWMSGVGEMDVIRRGSVVPHTSLPPPNLDLGKFVELNVVSRRCPATTAKLSSSTDAPRKPVPRETDQQPALRRAITAKPRDSSLLEKSFRETSTPLLVWEELQKLTERDTGPSRWVGKFSQDDNLPLFLCLPGIKFEVFSSCLLRPA